MGTERMLRGLLIIVVLALNVGCDQVSKSIIRQKIVDNQQIGFVNHYLIITKVENTGAFLSMGSALPSTMRFALLTVLPVITLVLMVAYLFIPRNQTRTRLIGLSFVVGGGIGNLYDRVMYGSVTDFLHINFGIFETGIFNMADVSILTGMALIVLGSYLDKRISTIS